MIQSRKPVYVAPNSLKQMAANSKLRRTTVQPVSKIVPSGSTAMNENSQRLTRQTALVDEPVQGDEMETDGASPNETEPLTGSQRTIY